MEKDLVITFHLGQSEDDAKFTLIVNLLLCEITSHLFSHVTRVFIYNRNKDKEGNMDVKMYVKLVFGRFFVSVEENCLVLLIFMPYGHF